MKEPSNIEQSIHVLLTNYLAQAKSINHLFFWNQLNMDKDEVMKSLLIEELDGIEEKLYNQQKIVKKLIKDLYKK